MKIRCENCKQNFEVDEKNVDTNLEYMQCPNCGATTKNPFKKI